MRETKSSEVLWVSAHIGEAFHSFCEVFDDFICVAVLDAVAHAVLDVPL